MKMHRFQLIDQKLKLKGLLRPPGGGTFVQNSISYKKGLSEDLRENA